MTLKRIPKRTVGESVFEQLKEAISSGEWKQGEKIPSENELASIFGVSRLTVRSALQKLSGLGIVKSRQGEGTYVCALDGAQYINSMIPMLMLEDQDAFYMLEFRHMLECRAAALATLRANDEDLELLKNNYQSMTEIDPFSEESSLLDMEFHFTLARATKNPILIKTFEVLQDAYLKTIRDISSIMPANNALYYHAALIDAIESRNEEQAREVMAEHIEMTMQYLQNAREKRGIST